MIEFRVTRYVHYVENRPHYRAVVSSVIAHHEVSADATELRLVRAILKEVREQLTSAGLSLHQFVIPAPVGFITEGAEPLVPPALPQPGETLPVVEITEDGDVQVVDEVPYLPKGTDDDPRPGASIVGPKGERGEAGEPTYQDISLAVAEAELEAAGEPE